MASKNSFSGIYDVLQAPVLTEKSNKALEDSNKYVFKVKPNITKKQVKEAVENIFAVKVIKVNSLIVEGKRKIFKGIKGKRKDYKKVLVTLEKGNNIDLNAGIK